MKKAEESVAERAVRGAMAGYVYCERKIVRVDELRIGIQWDGAPSIGYEAMVRVFIPKKAVNEMLRREQAAKKRVGKKTRRI